MTGLRVLVVDADPLARRALSEQLAAQPGVEVATAANADAGIAVVEQLDVDVVIMDARPDDDDSLRAIGRFHAAAAGVAVLILSTADDPELGLRALRENASGFLCKDVPLEALGRIVHSLARGEVVITRRMTARVVEQLREPRGSPSTRAMPAAP